jgi:hypothetical protein
MDEDYVILKVDFNNRGSNMRLVTRVPYELQEKIGIYQKVWMQEGIETCWGLIIRLTVENVPPGTHPVMVVEIEPDWKTFIAEGISANGLY